MGEEEETLEHTRLHFASHNGGLAEVAAILRSSGEGVRLDSRNTSGYTPVHLAVCAGHLDVVRMLVDHGADVNVSSSGDNTPLHSAVSMAPSASRLSVVQVLARSGASLDATNWLGDTPLYGAGKTGDASVLGELLRLGADARAVNGKGETVMHAVAESGSVEAARALAREAAGRTTGVFNARCWTGRTPLHFASARGHAGLCDWMIENGARVNEVDDHGWTPLHEAAALKRLPAFTGLVRRGADTDARSTTGGRTALDMTASATNHGDFVSVVECFKAARKIAGALRARASRRLADDLRADPVNLFDREFAETRRIRLGIDGSAFSGFFLDGPTDRANGPPGGRDCQDGATGPPPRSLVTRHRRRTAGWESDLLAAWSSMASLAKAEARGASSPNPLDNPDVAGVVVSCCDARSFVFVGGTSRALRAAWAREGRETTTAAFSEETTPEQLRHSLRHLGLDPRGTAVPGRAALAGNLPCLVAAAEEGCAIDGAVVEGAIARGHAHVLRWLSACEIPELAWDDQAVLSGAFRGFTGAPAESAAFFREVLDICGRPACLAYEDLLEIVRLGPAHVDLLEIGLARLRGFPDDVDHHPAGDDDGRLDLGAVDLALLTGSLRGFDLLVESGFPVDEGTVLSRCLQGGSMELLETLIERDGRRWTEESSRVGIMVAVSDDRVEDVRACLSQPGGAEVFGSDLGTLAMAFEAERVAELAATEVG